MNDPIILDWSNPSQVRVLRQLADLIEAGKANMQAFAHNAAPGITTVTLTVMMATQTFTGEQT